MTPNELNRYHSLYEQHLTNLKLHGKRPATIDAYSRAVRRISPYFDCSPDSLTTDQLKQCFASLIQTHSWSNIKFDRNGLQFFYHYTLDKQWQWLNIVKPPRPQTLPDVMTPNQVATLISQTQQLQMRTLPTLKFLMLILQHVLPKGLQRVRDYYFLRGQNRQTLIRIQLLLLRLFCTPIALEPTTTSKATRLCPCCQHEMMCVGITRPR
uniref:phage integrase N-terminal SAM-like domain-containing protein n=1 Tax=Vibrio panuliri TaxID=1381081 RepID=UPI000ADB1572